MHAAACCTQPHASSDSSSTFSSAFMLSDTPQHAHNTGCG
jgi:hypothetical protein